MNRCILVLMPQNTLIATFATTGMLPTTSTHALLLPICPTFLDSLLRSRRHMKFQASPPVHQVKCFVMTPHA
ncbi:uncharacterized protein EI90DRAFT_3035308 [Cantharellus anzutake]|uniref:uncharacterized protein n=1 Tax=Cantharellus anzutake TaxID=1750568 RepID=UPI001908EEF6|nr:uncharacterized protein EI90DRAFT_3035308 [Cantharellus anzutake]KAF8340361.1 hypothetical protein EI90DRAFT_3035308 [Cantharellus anzutake]